jgi:Bacterial PH domain
VSYMHDPDHYLLPTERRVIRMRRHWCVVAKDILQVVVFMVILILLSAIIPGSAWLVQTILWYAGLVVIARFAYKLYEWWDEILVVTDKRFILTGGVFTVKIAMMPIGKVTDLTYERSASGHTFGYGTLIVESAGQIQGLNRIDYLPHPEEIYDAISELVFGDKQSQAERFSMIKAQRLARGKKIVG